MSNDILKQFGITDVEGRYTIGTVLESKLNGIFVIRTSRGLKVTIQDYSISLVVGDPVLLALSGESTNSYFILKKSGSPQPVATNFVIDNGVN